MKVIFSNLYSHVEKDFGITDGGTIYGNRLLQPIIDLRRKLEALGFEVLTRQELELVEADIAVFWDLDNDLYKKAKSLPKTMPCILICTESPIYAPFSHHAHILFSKRWSAVMTWNRSFSSNNIFYYDIPIAGVGIIECLEQADNSFNQSKIKGIVVSSCKRDIRGTTKYRDRLYSQLAHQGYIDLYGQGWPVNEQNGIFGSTLNKIQTMRQYSFSLISENSIYPGYVTEKLADSILAGIPAIYYGDFRTAQQRFPDTFIQLKELTVPAFLRARKELMIKYEQLREHVSVCRSQSNHWADTFIDTLVQIICLISEEPEKKLKSYNYLIN